METKARRQNDTLDLWKCIGIYAVVLAHIPLPGRFGRYLCAWAKFSVPVFFMASGYFSWNRDSRTVGKRAVNTGKLLLEVAAALLVLGCVLAVRQGETLTGYLLSRCQLFFVKELVLFQMLPLPYSWPMWFQGSLFVAYLFWWLLTKISERMGRKLPYDWLALGALALLVLNLSLTEFRVLGGLEAVPNRYVRNAWLDAIPFFALGAWFGEHQADIRAKCRVQWLWAGAALGTGLSVVEFLLVDVVDVLVGTTLVAAALMAISLCRPQVQNKVIHKTACFCGKNLTFYIFVTHIPLYGIMQEWQEQVPLFAWVVNEPWLRTLIVASLSTVLALGLYKLSRWRKSRSSMRKDGTL